MSMSIPSSYSLTHIIQVPYTTCMSLAQKRRSLVMLDMRNEGATYEEIGRAFKVTRQRVHQILKRLSTGTIDNSLQGE